MIVSARLSIPVLALGAALVASGCGGGGDKPAAKKQPAVREQSAGRRGPTAPGASVVFVTPRPGSKTGPTVRVRVRATKFKLDPAAVGKRPKPGTGHLHFAMDGGRYDRARWSPTASSPLAAKLRSAGVYSPSTTASMTYRRLPKGDHRLVVYLVNNDETNTDISATTIFTVR